MPRNRIRCRNCGEVLESKYRHDFQVCKCWRDSKGEEGVAVDGGNDYRRFVGKLEWIEDLVNEEEA